MNKCIIVTHGDLGRAILSTTERIIGEQDGIKVISNEHISLKDLIGQLDAALDEWQDSEILILVDFCGGSCWHAAQVVKKDRDNVVLLSNVNLSIMMAYINRRESFRLPELAEYLRESSVKSTTVISGTQNTREDNAVPDNPEND